MYKIQMGTPQISGPAQAPGFIAVLFDVPFPISVPNGSYISYDPKRGIAVVTVTLKEGSRAFFRNTAITGPTSFEELRRTQQEPPRPREGHSYIATSGLPDGTQKATLNVNSGAHAPFLMFMRLFWPKPEALDGEWKQPTLHQTRLGGHDPQLRKSSRQVEN